MRKKTAALTVFSLILLTGCGGIKDPMESTVTVDKKGVITQALVEDFSKEGYKLEELKTSIQKLADEYNQEAGEEKVVLEEASVKEQVATVFLEYDSDEDYRGFNRVDFFAGTVAQADKEGYAFDGDFVDQKGKDVKAGTVPDQCADLQVMIVREPISVLVPGKIAYVSKNMEIQAEDQARLADDTGIAYEEAQLTTESYGYVIYEGK